MNQNNEIRPIYLNTIFKTVTLREGSNELIKFRPVLGLEMSFALQAIAKS